MTCSGYSEAIDSFVVLVRQRLSHELKMQNILLSLKTQEASMKLWIKNV